jgi:hypothetical protein
VAGAEAIAAGVDEDRTRLTVGAARDEDVVELDRAVLFSFLVMGSVVC